MTFDLVDGVEQNRKHPTTFRIPSQELKTILGAGDFVKFGFVLPKPKGNVTIERMWVQVAVVVNGIITGTLANDPAYLDGIRFGDVVRGELRHVLAVHQAKKPTLQ